MARVQIVFLRAVFCSGHGIVFRRPGAQINQFAALAAKRALAVFRQPSHVFAAGGAGDGERFGGGRHQRITGSKLHIIS